ncbi:MAG: hypothetical protein E7426_06415 [Ruminococcaceae bacterium]|nr:hypothetical protein [Oscillospiraceae bacterium]
METKVYFVPVVDISWKELGPLNPRKNYSCPPPPLEKCAAEADGIVDLYKKLLGGKLNFTVYTGTYCRDDFTAEPFNTIWRRCVDNGGEILVHTHEEIARVGTRNNEEPHMREVIRRQYDRMKAAGIQPAGFRGGLYGYANFLTPLMEELDLTADLTAAPGVHKPDRAAEWEGVPYTAWRLCRTDKRHVDCDCNDLSRVVEIPLGGDGLGTENENYLYVDYDLSSLENAKRIWDCVLARYEASGKPQMIHTLFHTFSMSDPAMVERYSRFSEYMLSTGGVPVNATEARDIFERELEHWGE